jgi:alpha-glucosidase
LYFPNKTVSTPLYERSWRCFARWIALRREHAGLHRSGQPNRQNDAADPRKWHWRGRSGLLMSQHFDRGPKPLPDASILLCGNEA